MIEVDGSIHATRQDYDQLRDTKLLQAGYQVLRFTNEEVIDETSKVIKIIQTYLPCKGPGVKM